MKNKKNQTWNLAKELFKRDGSIVIREDGGIQRYKEFRDTLPKLQDLGFRISGNQIDEKFHIMIPPKGWKKKDDHSHPRQMFSQIYDPSGEERIQQMYFESHSGVLGQRIAMIINRPSIHYGFEEAFLSFLDDLY